MHLQPGTPAGRLAAAPAAASTPGTGGIVEREADLSRLEQHVADRASAAVLLVQGPAGIGKTRLITEARTRAHQAGRLVLAARGTQLEHRFAFGVVRQLFEPFLAGADPADRAELLAGRAAAATPLFSPAGVPEAEAASDLTLADTSFAVLHGLYWLTVNIATRQPVVLVVDDLHWVDISSLRWLLYLLPRIEGIDAKIVAGLRPGQSDSPLIDQIACDPATDIIHPAPLSEAGTDRLLRAAFGEVAPEFVRECHAEAGGNPLYLRELISAVKAEQLAPAAQNIARIHELGGRAASQTVAVRLAVVPAGAVRVAEALAVLGDGADLGQVAELAAMPVEAAGRAVTALVKTDIVHPALPLGFVHPIVQAAVYAHMSSDRQLAAHAVATRMLMAADADPERIAAQLLVVPSSVETDAARILREAARSAVRRGAADSAYAYLKRCLTVPLDPLDRLEVLVELGSVAQLVDVVAAAEFLRRALDLAVGLDVDADQRAHIAWQLGNALLYVGRMQDAEQTWTNAIKELPPGDGDTRRRLQACLLFLPSYQPGLPHLLDAAKQARALPAAKGQGAWALRAALAQHDAFAGEPDAVELALDAVHDEEWMAEDFMSSRAALWVLAASDVEESVDVLDRVLARINQHGDMRAWSIAHNLRAHCWLERGQLAEAERDAREAQRCVELTGLGTSRLFTGAFLSGALVEQGRLAQARAVLAWTGIPDVVPDSGPMYLIMDARARFWHAAGDYERGLASALATGERFAAHGGQNPAFIPWRSRAALCLQALGRSAEAEQYAAAEVDLARRWTRPRPLGRALRIHARLTPGAAAVEQFGEAVAVLRDSSAQLEYAWALADLGAALRRTGRRADAREPLRQALDIATLCGAQPLAKRARTELLAAGARPRRAALTGPGALTPSERRVAELAAGSATNRQIAQELFVTPKTVEIHLSSVYRKLGITSRARLAEALRT